jgi:hypothetical protein
MLEVAGISNPVRTCAVVNFVAVPFHKFQQPSELASSKGKKPFLFSLWSGTQHADCGDKTNGVKCIHLISLWLVDVNFSLVAARLQNSEAGIR